MNSEKGRSSWLTPRQRGLGLIAVAILGVGAGGTAVYGNQWKDGNTGTARLVGQKIPKPELKPAGVNTVDYSSPEALAQEDDQVKRSVQAGDGAESFADRHIPPEILNSTHTLRDSVLTYIDDQHPGPLQPYEVIKLPAAFVMNAEVTTSTAVQAVTFTPRT